MKTILKTLQIGQFVTNLSYPNRIFQLNRDGIVERKMIAQNVKSYVGVGSCLAIWIGY